ncbi:membrane-associated phospholipid phosphatase [Neobacillus niacini]|uniref:phosphatase PAP2 family protein n=1 Tax=Neobacillus driksii TaxID=3035913 RepID=UPI00278AFC8D|nr:phosphatase PAP2 family protein [Neobacillus niacini]MDQ0973071.1 membrane-associated phospholipid phosphatase [Neobacillus niacini]
MKQMVNKRNTSTYLSLGIAVVIAIYISIKVATKQTFWLDEKLADLFSYVPDIFNPFLLLITELGDKKGIGIVALIVLGWLLLKRNLLGAAAIALSVALGNEINKLLKELIARPRPELDHLAHVDSLSFPSGHAMVGFIFYYLIAYLVLEDLKSSKARRMIIMLTVLLLLLIGSSRIILQVHYPTDVIGGFAFGYIWVLASIYIYNFFKKKLKK